MSSSPPQLKTLRTYAKLDDASITRLLPPTVYFSHTRYTLTIFDAYPKALFHFLILPRLRVAPVTAAAASPEGRDEAGGDDDGGGGGGDDDAGELIASATDLDLTNLRTLLLRATTTTDGNNNNNSNTDACTAIGLSVLRVLEVEAARVRREIEREMESRYGFVWDIWVGFHAVPSME
jgi:aprataxin